jgi:hypothetical protein
MYRIQTGPADWAVLGERNERMFSGTPRECEDWLDQQENVHASRSEPIAGRRWFFLAGAISGGRRWFRTEQPGQATQSAACR